MHLFCRPVHLKNINNTKYGYQCTLLSCHWFNNIWQVFRLKKMAFLRTVPITSIMSCSTARFCATTQTRKITLEQTQYGSSKSGFSSFSKPKKVNEFMEMQDAQQKEVQRQQLKAERQTLIEQSKAALKQQQLERAAKQQKGFVFQHVEKGYWNSQQNIKKVCLNWIFLKYYSFLNL